MDPNTGKIKEFETRKDADAAGYTVPVGCMPKPNCKKCYGRGHVGRNVDTGRYVPCSCVKPMPS